MNQPQPGMPAMAPMTIRSVTVYCSSSSRVERQYFDAATQLGAAIAGAGWATVYGGNHTGCMGALADGARSQGGDVIGITPRFFHDGGVADPNCTELILVDSMRERKRLLEERADAFVVLPGGIGTFEEFFECLVNRQLGHHAKPIVLLDLGGFYQPMRELLLHGLEHRFIREGVLELLYFAPSVPEAIAYLHRAPTLPPPAPIAIV